MFCWPCILVRSLWTTNMTHNFLLICLFLYCTCFFRAAMCPSSGELLYQCDIWFPFQSDINQVSHWYNNSPDDGHMTARNMYRTEINIQEKTVRQVGYLQGPISFSGPDTLSLMGKLVCIWVSETQCGRTTSGHHTTAVIYVAHCTVQFYFNCETQRSIPVQLSQECTYRNKGIHITHH